MTAVKAKKLDTRAKEIQLCAIGRAELIRKGIFQDIDSARDVMQTVTGQRSASDMDWTQRKRWLDHLKKLGFKPTAPRGRKTFTPRAKPVAKAGAVIGRALADDPQSKKIRALWLELHAQGIVRNSAESALAAYVQRQTGVSALQWLDSVQASNVIESLKNWLSRASLYAGKPQSTP